MTGNLPAISVLQPYASLLAIGAKRFETRGWASRYRGELAIHAGRRWTVEQQAVAQSEWFARALRAAGLNPESLPLGAILAVAELTDVRPTTGLVGVDQTYPRDMGVHAELEPFEPDFVLDHHEMITYRNVKLRPALTLRLQGEPFRGRDVYEVI